MPTGGQTACKNWAHPCPPAARAWLNACGAGCWCRAGPTTPSNRSRTAEDRDEEQYASLLEFAPTPADGQAIQSVREDEQGHSWLMRTAGKSVEQSLARSPAWIRSGTANRGRSAAAAGSARPIYGANDGLGSVFGIVSGWPAPPPADRPS